MKPEQMYQHLKELSEKLGIEVIEKSFKRIGFHVRSGSCKIKDKNVFLMDKHRSIRDKVGLLAECLGAIPSDDEYVVPAVRDLLKRYKKKPTDPDPQNEAEAQKRVEVLESSQSN
jgi:hypothetical protein